MLSAPGRREEVLAAHKEAVRSLAPLFRQFPAAFTDWMETMVHNYLRACQALGRTPDEKMKSVMKQPET